MSEKEIYEILQNALVNLFEIDPSKITPEALIYEDLGIDSIDAVDLVDHIKKKTGHRLEPQDFKAVRTISDIVAAVLKKLENS